MEIRSIDEFLRYYEKVHARTERVVRLIPPDRLEWSPGDGRFTPGDLARHIAATKRYMWAENVKLRPSRYPGCGRDLADGHDEIMAFTAKMHDESMEIFRTLGPEDLEARCTTVAGVPIRVWKWLRAMVEHEVHHRGQLYGLLSLMDVETPSLYGLTEPQVLDGSEPLKKDS